MILLISNTLFESFVKLVFRYLIFYKFFLYIGKYLYLLIRISETLHPRPVLHQKLGPSTFTVALKGAVCMPVLEANVAF